MSNLEPYDQYSTAANGKHHPSASASENVREHFLDQLRSTITREELAHIAIRRRAFFQEDPSAPGLHPVDHIGLETESSSANALAPGRVVNVWEQTEPPPRLFIIEGMVPSRSVTALYGDGGQGKSLLALAIGTHVILGRDFMGRKVAKGPVLYVDGELDAQEFISRAYHVARGMGLDRPPAGLHYYQLPGPLTDPAIQENVMTVARGLGVQLMILDSLTMSTYGADPKDAQDTIGIIKYLERVATVLAIDHVTKPVPGANMSNMRQYGSVFKWNGARSVVQIIKADAGGLILTHKKTNFSALGAPIYIRPVFESNVVRFEAITADDEAMSGIDDHLPAKERVYRELLTHTDGAKPEGMTEALGMKVPTVRNHLTTLKHEGRADSLGGIWWGLKQVVDDEAHEDEDSADD